MKYTEIEKKLNCLKDLKFDTLKESIEFLAKKLNVSKDMIYVYCDFDYCILNFTYKEFDIEIIFEEEKEDLVLDKYSIENEEVTLTYYKKTKELTTIFK